MTHGNTPLVGYDEHPLVGYHKTPRVGCKRHETMAKTATK